MDTETISTCQPSIGLHTFKDKLLDKEIFFQVMRLKDSFYLWIGNTTNMGNLALAMKPTATQGALATSIQLFGDSTNNISCTFAEKLAKKTGKQVFVSCNVNYDQLLIPLIEKRIFTELNSVPDKF